MRALAFVYGVVAYAAFLATFLYAIAFVGNLPVPKTLDTGPAGPLVPSLLINALLLGLFALQHTVMARPAFKAWWTRYVPKPIERSTFVLFASAALALMMWQWRPLPGTVWHIGPTWARLVVWAISSVGWGLVLYSSFLIDHFELFGLRQVWSCLRGRPHTPPRFVERSVYKRVRHPLMLGFLIAFWATPEMSVGHLFFALLITGYVLMGTWLEERDLVRALGDDYRRYQRRTPKLIPRLGPRPRVSADALNPAET